MLTRPRERPGLRDGITSRSGVECFAANLEQKMTNSTRSRLLWKKFLLLKRSEGAQLLEFALSLPILLVVMIGIFDFGQAWNTKQELANSVREGLRIGSEAPTADLTQSSCSSPSASSPCSVQAIADAVIQ